VTVVTEAESLASQPEISEDDVGLLNPLPTPDQAVRRLADVRQRVAPAGVRRLTDAAEPGLYAWFGDVDGAGHLTEGHSLPVGPGLIYAGQAGAGGSKATLGSRINGNHLGGDIYGSTFRLTLAAALRTPLALEPIGGRRMTREGEGRLTDWMRQHLMVSALAYPDRLALDAFETVVLARLDPPLNLAKRPPTPIRRRLTALRWPFGGMTDSSASTIESPRSGSTPSEPSTAVGSTPERLARELGLPNAKRIRAFLRARFPRPISRLGSPWGSLTPEMERAVRDRFRTDR
jgi:hypothetical protein